MNKILTLELKLQKNSERRAVLGNPYYDGVYSRFFVYCFDTDLAEELEFTCKDLGAYQGNYELEMKAYGNGIYEVRALGDLHVSDFGSWSMIYRKFFMYSNDIRRDNVRNQSYYPVTISASLNQNAVRRLA